jgi:nucleotide-binding universal stress UspA family protein
MQTFKNILYVNESNVEQTATLARAVSLAERNQAVLTVVDVVPIQVVQVDMALPPGGPVSTKLQAFIVAERRNTLNTLLQPYRQRLSIRGDVLIGKTYIEVIRAVIKNGHDLVMKPAENPSWSHMLFGNDDLHLLRKCPCPTWLMKSSEKSNYRNIVAAVDFDPLRPSTSERDLNSEIFSVAGRIALSDRASLHLVHAWEAFAETHKLTRGEATEKNLAGYAIKEYAQHQNGLFMLAEELRGSIGKDAYDALAPSFHLPKGSAKKLITSLVTELEADLVVMGTVARTGVMGLIVGNTAEAILDQLSCSVLTIKPPGFEMSVLRDA